MTLREFFATLWRAKFEVLGAIVIVVGGAGLYLDRQEAEYEVTAEVRLASADAAIEGAEVGAVTIPAEASQVRSDPVMQAAAETLGVPVADLRGRVSASVEGSSVDITVTGTDVQEATVAAEAVTVAYADWLAEFRSERIEYFSDRRSALSEDLTALGPASSTDGVSDDPLGDAERDLIITEYTTITVELRTLQAVPAPPAGPVAGVDVDELGLPWEVTMAAAVLAGLVAGIGLAFARRGLDTRVRTSERATSFTGAPVLAEVRRVTHSVRDFHRTEVLPVTRRTATPFTESIRELRTAIEVATAGVEHPVVVITAADKYEPRAFITANVVASFGLSGLSVIAVSGDLRRPRLSDLLPVQDPDTAEDLAPVADVPHTWLQRMPESSLDPADLLATAGVRDLIEQTRRRADIVIIDAPPVLAAADATILGRYATTSVLLAAAPRTNRTVLTHAVERLRTSSVRFAGIALAEVRVGRSMSHASTYGDDSASGEPLGPQEPMEEAAEEAGGATDERPVGPDAGRGATAPSAETPADPDPGETAQVAQAVPSVRSERIRRAEARVPPPVPRE